MDRYPFITYSINYILKNMNLRKSPPPPNRTHYLFNRRKTSIEKDKSTSRRYKNFNTLSI